MNDREPDIAPCRMTPVDVLFLSNIAIRAIRVHLAGHEDPVVSAAVVKATQKVLARTRGEG